MFGLEKAKTISTRDFLKGAVDLFADRYANELKVLHERIIELEESHNEKDEELYNLLEENRILKEKLDKLKTPKVTKKRK